jgi:hypothetical protein
MLNIVNKHTVLKEVRQNGTWQGYIAPNNVNAANVNGYWNLGCPVCIIRDREGNFYEIDVNNSNCDMVELETLLNNFKYYNCIAELGKRVRFWQ